MPQARFLNVVRLGAGAKFLVGAKLANYRSRGFSVDTDKIWIWAEAKF